jgi:hypothetical protein
MFICTSHGKWVFPPSCGVFLLLLLLQVFLLLIAGHVLLLLLAGVFVYSSHGRWTFSPLLWSFLPSTPLTIFPDPGCWVSAPTPAPSGASLACLFTVLGRIPLSPSLELRAPHPLCQVSIVLISYYSVSLFSPGGGQSVQGAMLIWPRVVCGNTVYHLAHLVCVFPSRLGMGNWWLGGPPGFPI